MKTVFLVSVFCLTVTGACAQGTIHWGNNFSGVFRAPIYGLEFYPEAPGPLTGQSSLGIPTGTTVYHAPLLSGTGYTFAIYGGPASVNDPEALTFLVATTFRTGTGTGLPRGLVTGGTIVVPGVLPGERIKFQIRAWDNLGGTLPTWPGGGWTPSQGTSVMVLSDPLGGMDSLGNLFETPITDGWSSFSFWIPEPSSWLLGLTAAVGFGCWRRRLNAFNRN